MTTATASAGLRTDAARNHARILAVAEDVFARKGLAATMDDVAAAAGVGVGTVYRRFGSKDGLIAALFGNRLDEFSGVVAEAVGRPSAWDGLSWLLREYVETQARSRALKELFSSVPESATEILRERVVPALADLVARAKAEGAVRDDFAATDIPVLTHTISGIAHDLPGQGLDLARRHLELLLKGIAATPDPVPVPPPLPDAEFASWLRSTGSR